ncbi:MAG TPA: ABC transporter permease subunit [Thermomonospora sp.]|nr:ABC transporter permease subunit [Thermomonospora sp.]
MTEVWAIVNAEWTKLRTVRSTYWTLALTVAVSAGLAYLVGHSLSGSYDGWDQDRRDDFDPLFASFLPLMVGQLVLVVFGVLAMSAEYSGGTIHASLTAVPRRGRFYAGKVLAVLGPALAVSVAAVLAAFFAGQAGLGGLGTSPGAAGVPRAMAGSVLVMTLMCLFALGLTAVARSATRVLAVLLPLLLLNSQGLGQVPALKPVMQYLPDQAGMVIMHVAGPQDDPRWARDYGPWTGLGVVALWAAAALLAGLVALRRRDA